MKLLREDVFAACCGVKAVPFFEKITQGAQYNGNILTGRRHWTRQHVAGPYGDSNPECIQSSVPLECAADTLLYNNRGISHALKSWGPHVSMEWQGLNRRLGSSRIGSIRVASEPRTGLLLALVGLSYN